MNERLVIFGGYNSTSKCMGFNRFNHTCLNDQILLNYSLNQFDG